MWRLLPLLAVLAFLEVLVPWPDVAALVLTNAGPVDAPGSSTYPAPAGGMHLVPKQLLVEARDPSH